MAKRQMFQKKDEARGTDPLPDERWGVGICKSDKGKWHTYVRDGTEVIFLPGLRDKAGAVNQAKIAFVRLFAI